MLLYRRGCTWVGVLHKAREVEIRTTTVRSQSLVMTCDPLFYSYALLSNGSLKPLYCNELRTKVRTCLAGDAQHHTGTHPAND